LKITLHILALFLAVLLVLGAAQLARLLPTDSQEFVEKKYAGWSGVLRGWVCTRWSAAGSFTSWLNACAAEFEKAHEGVYLEFTAVTEQAMAQLFTSGMRPPELVFFSPGVITDGRMLTGAQRLAMGGYVWVYNCALADGAPAQAVCLPDDMGHSFSIASVCMHADPSAPELKIEEPGLDLGLPASATAQNIEISLDAFIDGELPALIVSQSELARLIRLRDAGKGPDWACAPAGEWALTDQLLTGAATAGEAAALAEEFIRFLRSDGCQDRLADIGAFSVTERTIYPAHSAYAAMEIQLKSRRQLGPEIFSEYPPPNSDGIVRIFREGQISAGEALNRIFPGSYSN